MEIKYSTRETHPKRGFLYIPRDMGYPIHFEHYFQGRVLANKRRDEKRNVPRLLFIPKKQLPTKYKRTIQQENHVFYLMKSRCLTSMELK